MLNDETLLLDAVEKGQRARAAVALTVAGTQLEHGAQPQPGRGTMRRKQKSYMRTMEEESPKDLADMNFLKRCAAGEHAEVDAMLEAGQDVDVSDERGDSAAHKAVRGGHVQTVAALLRRGALCDAEDVDGVRPISVALELQHEELVKALMSYGADLTKRAKDGSTLLHSTAWAGHEAMVARLLSSGAFAPLLEATDAHGRTALHIAAFRAPGEICRMLVQAGASPAAKDARGLLPEELAGRVNRQESKTYLNNCRAAFTATLVAARLRRRLLKKHEAGALTASLVAASSSRLVPTREPEASV